MRGMSKLKALTGTAVAGSALVAAFAGTASAATTTTPTTTPSAASPATASAPDTPGQFCGTYGNGYTNVTVWHKKPPGCRDFNIVWAKRSGYYYGEYKKDGVWTEGSNGVRWRTGGRTWDQVAVSNVATNTPLRAERIGGVNYNVHVNY